jgi:undecaprenyl-diphosphatase
MTDATSGLDALENLDRSIFTIVASWHSPLLDRTMPELSVAASQSRLWMAIAALLAIFGGDKGRRTAVEGMVAVGGTSFMANVVLKHLTRRNRPTDPVPEERRLVQPESSSFPSGHSASAAAFSGIVGRAYPKLWLPINGLAATVGFHACTPAFITRVTSSADGYWENRCVRGEPCCSTHSVSTRLMPCGESSERGPHA